jgi:DNA-binding NarL/FixJ family response regulator
MGKISVLLVEDHSVVREGLRALLQTQPDIEVVGEAGDGLEAVKLARKIAPEVVVMDISMPVLNGLEASRQILRASPSTKILVLSSYDDSNCVEEMTEAGVKGFLSKRTAGSYLAEAIRAVRGGKTFYSPEVAKRVREQQAARASSGRGSKNPFALTQRELEVLQLIAEGLPNKGIAVQLGISIKTVEKHRQGAMNKLGIHEVAGLTRYALSQGLVSEKVPVRREPSADQGQGGNEPVHEVEGSADTGAKIAF